MADLHNLYGKKAHHNSSLESGHVELPEHRGDEKGERGVAQDVENDNWVPDSTRI
jgi:hypothetical protein